MASNVIILSLSTKISNHPFPGRIQMFAAASSHRDNSLYHGWYNWPFRLNSGCLIPFGLVSTELFSGEGYDVNIYIYTTDCLESSYIKKCLPWAAVGGGLVFSIAGVGGRMSYSLDWTLMTDHRPGRESCCHHLHHRFFPPPVPPPLSHMEYIQSLTPWPWCIMTAFNQL